MLVILWFFKKPNKNPIQNNHKIQPTFCMVLIHTALQNSQQLHFTGGYWQFPLLFNPSDHCMEAPLEVSGISPHITEGTATDHETFLPSMSYWRANPSCPFLLGPHHVLCWEEEKHPSVFHCVCSLQHPFCPGTFWKPCWVTLGFRRRFVIKGGNCIWTVNKSFRILDFCPLPFQ